MKRKHVFQKNMSKPLHEKLDSAFLVQGAWGNIDSMNAKKNIRSVGAVSTFMEQFYHLLNRQEPVQ